METMDISSSKSTRRTIKTIDLPQFSSTNCEFWLETVDTILTMKNYDNIKKYQHVKKHLCNGVHDYIIENFEEESRTDGYMGDMYLGFRTYVLEEKKENELLTSACVESLTMSNLKPSVFLKIISKLLSAVPKSIIRTIWLARLPRSIQKVLMAAILKDPAPMEDWKLDNLAALADGVAAYEKFHSWYILSDDDTITLRPYNENDPEFWFYSAEEAFSLHNVVNEIVKYESCMRALRPHDIFTASLFLTELPNRATDQYENLRERIIKTFAIIKGDEIYRLVFRNKEGLKPSTFFYLLNDLAAKSGIYIPQLAVRTLWLMQLPMKTQLILFDMLAASREPLQELEMDALCLLADGAAESRRRLHRLFSCSSDQGVEEEFSGSVLDEDLKMAKTLHEKITIGVRYCDYMHKVYYDHIPSESLSSSNSSSPESSC